jgi:DNA-binding CsgD family transcriptional regulator
MGSKLKASGFFFGSIFLAAAAINLVTGIVEDKVPFIATLLDFENVLSLLLVGLFFIASALVQALAWGQPIVFLIVAPIPILNSTVSFFGLGFFVVGILLLFKLGFFSRYRIAKGIGSVVYLIVVEVAAALKNGESLYVGLMPGFFILAFIGFLFLTFRDRIFVYLKEPKPQLSLDAKGLADAEQLYTRAVISGRSVKEICFEFGVSESTVRNTLSRAYKKLGVVGKADMSNLANKYEIVK